MRPATILAGSVADTGVGSQLTDGKGVPARLRGRRVPATRAGGSYRAQSGQSERVRADRRGRRGVTPVDAAGWTSTPVRADSEEPTRRPRIVRTAGRPFPPPRARPVISGVVDVVGYAPVFFEPRVRRQPWERNFGSCLGFSSISGISRRRSRR